MKRYAPLAILILAALLRLFTLPKLLVFTPDEEYLLYIAQTLVKNFHIIWIGVSALGLDFYMGPFWIYIIYPFVGVTRGDPITLGIISSILGAFTALLLYFLGKKMFNYKVGLIATALYSTSALMVYYDQQPYPSGVPLLSLLMLGSLYLSKFSKRWWIVFAVLYALLFHIHLSLILIIFVAAYWAFLHKKLLDKKTIFLCIIAVLITLSPLIAFDYFHKASNITVPIRIVKSFSERKKKVDIAPRMNNLLQSFGRLFYLEPHRESSDEILYPCIVNPLSTTTKLNNTFCSVIFLAFVYYAVRRDVWKEDKKRLLLLFSLAFITPFLFLPIFNPIEYYLLGFFPVLFLVIAFLVEELPKQLKKPAYIVLALVMLHGIFTVLTAKGEFGLQNKKTLITKVMEVVKDAPFEISEYGGCQGSAGFRYLFAVYGRRPERSSEDVTFAWLWPDEVSNVAAKYSVDFYETRVSLVVTPGYITSIEQGGFTAYIYEY